MSDERKNISPEIEAALEEGRQAGLREAAEYLRGLKERRVSWLISWYHMSDADFRKNGGWIEMPDDEKRLLAGAAEGVERLTDHRQAPEHKHIWSQGEDPICALCGELKSKNHR